MILTIRTDKPEAEIGLYDGKKRLRYKTWQAHRQLAETLHTKLQQLLTEQRLDRTDVTGIVVYKGPGSFTGLRIGISVANALANSREVSAVGATGENWIAEGLQLLKASGPSRLVLPEYSSPVFTTPPKK